MLVGSIPTTQTMNQVTCSYCGKDAELVAGNVVYPHRWDLTDKKFWRCVPCDARVGCHPGTTEPLGRLADGLLRRAKMDAHAAFDPIWKRMMMKRTEAYGWLAKQMGIPEEDCHIGMFDLEQCNKAIQICRRFRR